MKKALKRPIGVMLSIILLFQYLLISPLVYAEESGIGSFNGSVASIGYTANVSFNISKIKKDKFTGSVSVTNIDPYSAANIPIEGKAYFGGRGYTLYCNVNFYNTTCWLDIDLQNGTARCIASGDYYGTVDFKLTSHCSADDPDWSLVMSQYPSFNKDDMTMCVNLCKNVRQNAIYNTTTYIESDNTDNEEDDKPELRRGEYDYYTENIEYRNVYYNTKSRTPFLTVYRKNRTTNAVDLIVVVTSTTGEQWSGNAEITGESYDYERNEHYNYEAGKNSIKYGITQAYGDIKKLFPSSDINLIITGHSRGGAVANIYAKDALEKTDGYGDDTIPTFNKVTAYTFGSPNVVKHTSFTESYDSIFNFCFEEDLFTTIPLAKPYLWNYWRYGKTFTVSVKSVKGLPLPVSDDMVSDVHKRLSPWASVDEYYNKTLNNTNETLYSVAHRALSIYGKGEEARYISAAYLYLTSKTICYDLEALIDTLAGYGSDISDVHCLDNYCTAIEKSVFTECSHSQFTPDLRANSISLRSSNNYIEYNAIEQTKLSSLYNYSNNANLLDWDITDPSSWTGITWNSSGNVTAIDLSSLELEGALDLSGFTALESVNASGNSFSSLDVSGCTALTALDVSGNNLTSVDVSDCTDLETLDCSFNDLSTSGLSLSANAALTSLTCDDCGLTTLNLSALTSLEELSCAFNELTTINVDNNTSLSSLICCYNYMDTHEGSTLYNKFYDLLFSDVYVNFYPQAVPDNATFNTNELNSLKAFALSENNNDALDWLDENDNIDTDKLQKNVLFEYDGSAYRVVAIDIADCEIEGELNLSALTKLKELYCENTGISSVNVNSCTSLSTLSCKNCEIDTLTLPNNASSRNTPLYNVSCEYNYIDTSIFTEAIVEYITFKAGSTLEYENQKWEDGSVLIAVMEFAGSLNENDYSEESFEALSNLLEAYEDWENWLLTQDDVDDIVTEILNAISDLEPYLKLKLRCENGAITTVYDNETQSGSTHSVLFGESVTLTATPDANYAFDGWYERITQRIFSTDSTYTFPMTTNLDLVARFVKQNSAILTFTNDTGQIVAKIDNTPAEWLDITSLTDLLPDVPYKLGHTNGRWDYTEADVLTALRAGTDVTITPVYDESAYVYPDVPLPVDGNPVLNLTFTYDDAGDIGSFIMGAGLPQGLDIESMGIAFYFKNKNTFVPDNYILTINNKSVVSRFDSTVPDNRYIVNVHRFAEKYNWCARGFVTFRDNGQLKIAYSNQMNVTNVIQNRRNVAISKSVQDEYFHHIDVIVGEDD